MQHARLLMLLSPVPFPVPKWLPSPAAVMVCEKSMGGGAQGLLSPLQVLVTFLSNFKMVAAASGEACGLDAVKSHSALIF